MSSLSVLSVLSRHLCCYSLPALSIQQVLTYPTVEFRCLAVCDVEIKARQVEHKRDTADCSEQLLMGWLLCRGASSSAVANQDQPRQVHRKNGATECSEPACASPRLLAQVTSSALVRQAAHAGSGCACCALALPLRRIVLSRTLLMQRWWMGGASLTPTALWCTQRTAARRGLLLAG